jgi:thiol-disulfide isomerase/thioredoxin
MTDSRDHATPRRLRLIASIAVAGVAAAVVGLAAVYGIGGLRGNQDVDAACVPGLKAAPRLAPFARGEVAAVSVLTRPRPVPDLRFDDEEGHGRSLPDWRGRLVLLNLWATWCVPCRREMPALDALQAALGGPDFEVVAVNIDTRDPAKPLAFLKEVGVSRLAYYTDDSARVFEDLKEAGKAFGMPTTVIVDRNGCEIGAMAGPAEWASDDGVKLVSAAIAGAQAN